MKPFTSHQIARGFCVVAGGLDFTTGLALVVSPTFTLLRMGAIPPAPELLGYIRFIGVFVAAVGASYLWAMVRGAAREIRTVLFITLFFRTGVGLYVGIAVLVAELERAWWVVSATDLTFAAIQGWLLLRGMGRDE